MFERIENLCKNHNTTITALCKEITGSSGNLPTWKKENFKNDSISKICIKFNVSADYLIFGKENQNNLSPDQQELLDLYNQLDPIKQAEFKGELKGYLKAKNNN